jgi:hypothetical protein
MDKLVAFSQPKVGSETLEALTDRARSLSKETKNIYWDSPHVQQRMRERNVTIRQILDVLRNGKGVDGPTLDKYGDWRIKMKRYSAGRTVQVVVVVNEDHLEVVTVI